MDNQKIVGTSGTFISAFEAFLAKQNEENNFKEGAASSPHGMITQSDSSKDKESSSM